MKRKRADSDSDPAEDKDFIPDAEEEEQEELEHLEDDDNADDLDLRTFGKSQTPNSNRAFVSTLRLNLGAFVSAPVSYTSLLQSSGYLKSSNGLSSNIMKTMWDAIETTKKL